MGLARVRRLNRNAILGISVSVGAGIALLLGALMWILSRRHIKNEVDVNEIHCSMSHRMYDSLGSSLERSQLG